MCSWHVNHTSCCDITFHGCITFGTPSNCFFFCNLKCVGSCNSLKFSCKGTAVPLHTREAQGERRYSSYSSMNSALDGEWVVSVTPRPRFAPGESPPPLPVPIGQEAGWVPEPVWTEIPLYVQIYSGVAYDVVKKVNKAVTQHHGDAGDERRYIAPAHSWPRY
jgi:hypothetical protein